MPSPSHPQQPPAKIHVLPVEIWMLIFEELHVDDLFMRNKHLERFKITVRQNVNNEEQAVLQLGNFEKATWKRIRRFYAIDRASRAAARLTRLSVRLTLTCQPPHTGFPEFDDEFVRKYLLEPDQDKRLAVSIYGSGDPPIGSLNVSGASDLETKLNTVNNIYGEWIRKHLVFFGPMVIDVVADVAPKWAGESIMLEYAKKVGDTVREEVRCVAIGHVEVNVFL